MPASGHRQARRGCGWLVLGCLLALTSAPGQAHDWYSGMKSRAKGVEGYSCCSGQDCRPIRARQDMDGRWLIWVPELRTWLPVPMHAVLPPDRFHDGRSHACTSKPGNPMHPVPTIYCFSPAEQKS